MEAKTYIERRRRFMAAMEGGVAILPSAPEARRNGDVHFQYRQDSDLWYLTGFGEPEAIAVLQPGQPEPLTLFVRPRDPEKETWTGRRAGVDGARDRFGADEAHPIDEFDGKLDTLLEGHHTLYYRLGRHPDLDACIQRALDRLRAKNRDGVRVPAAIIDPSGLVGELRLHKTAEELEVMRLAARVSADAHCTAMRCTRPGMSEAHVQGIVEYGFKRGGAQYVGYGSIVAGGANACVLHYTENDGVLGENDLLLIDAGAEFDGYSADITRTFPVSGKFSEGQRKLYQVVLDAQLAAIKASRAGTKFRAVHDVAVRRLCEGMVAIGLLEGEVDAIIEGGDYRRYYMHKTGHWLGLDVHDTGSYFADGGGSRLLEAGMVMTIEPGLYVSPDDDQAPPEFRGLGIRIEDDILITDSEPEVLTAGVPKEVDEIERLMAQPAELPL